MRTTRLAYDAAGHLTDVWDPMGHHISTTYNDVGQPLTVNYPATTNAQGQEVTPAETITYNYGDDGRTGSVTEQDGTDTRVVAFGYDPVRDLVTSVTETVNGSTVSTIGYKYGMDGEILEKDLPNGQTWYYHYHTGPGAYGEMPEGDPNSLAPRLIGIVDQDGHEVDYTFNELGTLCEARSDAQFDGSGNLTQCIAMDYTPDMAPIDSQYPGEYYYSHGWVGDVTNAWDVYDSQSNTWTPTTLSHNAYQYDAAGNQLFNTVFNPDGTTNRVEAYGYDHLNRLTGVEFNYPPGGPFNPDEAWWYDPVGNREPAGDHSYNTYNAANMLTASNDGNNPYSNDLDGNTLSGGGRTNTIWDAQNRLVSCSYTDPSNVTYTNGFTYGPDGLRRTSTVNGQTTTYVLDGQNVVQEVTGGAYTTYLYGPRGPECRIDPSSNVLWYIYDGHGNVLGEVNSSGVINPDSNGNPTQLRDYDPWGFVNNWQQVADNGNPLKYCGALGHPSESNTGLIYMRARYYDPGTGRFISEDPSRSGGNWFAYADGNPVTGSDSTGRLSAGEEAGAAAIAAGLGEAGGEDAEAIGGEAVESVINSVAEAFNNELDALFGEDNVSEGVWNEGRNAHTCIRWQIEDLGDLRLDFSGHDGLDLHINTTGPGWGGVPHNIPMDNWEETIIDAL